MMRAEVGAIHIAKPGYKVVEPIRIIEKAETWDHEASHSIAH
jgi:hypothetical protein